MVKKGKAKGGGVNYTVIEAPKVTAAPKPRRGIALARKAAPPTKTGIIRGVAIIPATNKTPPPMAAPVAIFTFLVED